MSTRTIDTDYLVIGAGAMGMAFTDVLMTQSDATVVMVDRHHRPGGHWNNAYPFVRLHQPSAFYGINSMPLGSDHIDATGWNKGLYELASAAEVCAYFDKAMHQSFLPSGRVRYFPMCEYQGDGRVSSLLTGDTFDVQVKNKTADATYMDVTVPSMREPAYAVAAGMRCVPPNELPRIDHPVDGYVIIGAGKTGMDACLWLLSNGVDPDDIRWIMPRDSWLLDRATIQPGELYRRTLLGAARQTRAIAEADSIDMLFANLLKAGQLLQFDEQVKPTMYRCATVTRAELEQLRRIRNIVRQGHVREVEEKRIVLDEGEIGTSPNILHVDCSADGLAKRPALPVFSETSITLQSVRTCQQVFSAAFIGHVETTYTDQDHKNRLCTVVPHPDSDIDWLRTSLANTLNQLQWSQDPDLQSWLANARLDGFSAAPEASAPSSAEQQETLQLLAQHSMTAVTKLQSFLDDLDV